MTTYREQSLRIKAIRRDTPGVDDVVRRRTRKARGDVVVEFRNGRIGKEWRVWRTYRRLSDAAYALSGFQRKYGFWEWRIRSEVTE